MFHYPSSKPNVKAAREDCKIVFGCEAQGYRDISGPLTYDDAINYLRANRHRISEDREINGLDIMYVDSGRLASWSL